MGYVGIALQLWSRRSDQCKARKPLLKQDDDAV